MTARRTTGARRLLTTLACLFLIAFATAPAQGHSPAGEGRGEAVVAAVLHSTATARAVPERLNLAPPSTLTPHLPMNAVLPPAVLIVLLLALWTPRRSVTGSSRQARLLSSAGPGPPLHS